MAPRDDIGDRRYPGVELVTETCYFYAAAGRLEWLDPGEDWIAMLEMNRWYSIEQYVKLNQPGQFDGVLRAWVDGRLAPPTGLRFRDIPELKIESVWMNVYHGGIDDAPKDLVLFIDNVVVARRYIGPMEMGN